MSRVLLVMNLNFLILWIFFGRGTEGEEGENVAYDLFF